MAIDCIPDHMIVLSKSGIELAFSLRVTAFYGFDLRITLPVLTRTSTVGQSQHLKMFVMILEKLV